ncbi:hypothetical protein V6C27_08660 [Peptococcaceae bacterium 1198_IL3148]
MLRKNSLLFLLCMVLTALLLVGCAADQPTDEQQVKKADTKEPSGATKDRDEPTKALTDEPTPEENEAKEGQEEPKGPALTVNLPPTMSTDYEMLKVSGNTEAGCTVFINGQSVRLKSDGTFSSEVALTAGNNTVEVVAVDENGNSTQVKRTVNFVVSKPALSVFAPSESSSAKVTVSGHTDPGCIVYLNNNKVKTDNNGSFTGMVELKKKGENTVNITAVNDYGLTTTVTKSINGVPPKIQVAAPEMTTTDRTSISGVSDANTSIVVLIGSEQVSVNNNDGTFNISLELEPGLNDITVMATNLFGTTEVPLTILYDDYGKED